MSELTDHEFTAHRLEFQARAETSIALGEHQGSAIRGALFHTLRGRPGRPAFCLDLTRTSCRGCSTLEGCPVSFLLATVDEEGRRGADVPRPYTVEPPLGRTGQYAPGEAFSFSITLFARALSLFPYLIVAARRLEEEGIGRKLQDQGGHWRAGRFRIQRILAVNTITGERQIVLQAGEELVRVPAVPIRHQQVLVRAERLARRKSLSLEFLTPTRLVENGRPLRRPDFRPLMQRLVERLSSLWEEYGQSELPVDFAALMESASKIKLSECRTNWVELRGYSTRQAAPKYLDGFVGCATYEGDIAPFAPWLVWGEQTHVGKDAVKGCGLYRIVEPEEG